MRLSQIKKLERELTEYVESMTAAMGRPERRRAMGWYVTGLLLDGERKSIEPMAARLVDDPTEIEAMRQRLQQCVSISGWSDRELLDRLALKLDRELPGIEALVVDDTGHPKKGTHSVGVARQYSGTLGRVDNCQVAVSLHLAGDQGSGCVAYDIYLNQEWAADAERRQGVGVPVEVEFRAKWEISLQQVDRALAAGVRKHVVLADAGYGDITDFRNGLTARGLQYVVGVKGDQIVWPPGSNPQVIPQKPHIRGKRPTRYRDEDHPPISIRLLARQLKFRTVAWREGTKGWQKSRFAVARVRTASRHYFGRPPGDEQWLLCEWPKGETAPTGYWLATLPPTTSISSLVRVAKLRWRVERDYQDMKNEVGLDHFEGRTWRGFHHHAALCAVAHGFLALRRALFPPEEAEVDASDGPEVPSTDSHAMDGLLPALPAGRQSSSTRRRIIEDVIG
jgi:SRSO17 transposase